MQVQALNQLEQMVLIGRIAEAYPQPIGLWLTRFGVQDSKFAGQVFVCLLFEQKHSSIRVSN
jgi:hypothetical protein